MAKDFQLLGLAALDLIKHTHRSAGIVIAAHPYRWSRSQGDYCYQLDIDGVEVDSNNTDHDAHLLAKVLARERNLYEITASDAHESSVIGKYKMIMQHPVQKPKDFIQYLQDNRS